MKNMEYETRELVGDGVQTARRTYAKTDKRGDTHNTRITIKGDMPAVLMDDMDTVAAARFIEQCAKDGIAPFRVSYIPEKRSMLALFKTPRDWTAFVKTIKEITNDLRHDGN